MNATAKSTEPKISLKNVLFATDFSKASGSALKYAIPIARKFNGMIHAVHVTPEPMGLPTSALQGLQAMGIQRNTGAHDSMQRLKKELSGIRSETLNPTGDIWNEISRIIEQKKIDLLVTGTHGRSGIGKLLMGSVAEKIFREARCPVLTVGPVASGEPDSIVDLHQILFPTDLSASSLAALPYAISLAQQSNARLYMLYVVENPSRAFDEQLLKDKMYGLLPRESVFSSLPKTFVAYGPPADKILDVAEELAVDLIVLSVKHTPLHFEASAHLPLATAYKVVRQATCPVLTVRG